MKRLSVALAAALLCVSMAHASEEHKHGDMAGHQHGDMSLIKAQNEKLDKNTDGKGFGPQSPRDLTSKNGMNKRAFMPAPRYQEMNLCNIHMHLNAEHKGGEFTKFAGAGDGHGNHTGYQYAGHLSANESKSLEDEVCKSEHGGLQAGETIEVHYVHSTAQVVPGETLKACLSESDVNPQLRVEAQVFVMVNDPKAANFNELVSIGERNGYQQALRIPTTTGKPIQYAGSTTGPTYNEKGSPLQVTWSVRPKVMKVSAASVGEWCKGNVFNEDHAHGVRNLVENPKLLSKMN
ncbi:MAG: hypothetical protein RJA34_1778 [Pseudomonadota bacterium]